MDRFSLPGAADRTMVGCLLADAVMSRTLFIFFMNVTDVSVCNSVARSSNGARACQDQSLLQHQALQWQHACFEMAARPLEITVAGHVILACNPGDVIQQPRSVRAAVDRHHVTCNNQRQATQTQVLVNWLTYAHTSAGCQPLQ